MTPNTWQCLYLPKPCPSWMATQDGQPHNERFNAIHTCPWSPHKIFALQIGTFVISAETVILNHVSILDPFTSYVPVLWRHRKVTMMVKCIPILMQPQATGNTICIHMAIRFETCRCPKWLEKSVERRKQSLNLLVRTGSNTFDLENIIQLIEERTLFDFILPFHFSITTHSILWNEISPATNFVEQGKSMFCEKVFLTIFLFLFPILGFTCDILIETYIPNLNFSIS